MWRALGHVFRLVKTAGIYDAPVKSYWDNSQRIPGEMDGSEYELNMLFAHSWIERARPSSFGHNITCSYSLTHANFH